MLYWFQLTRPAGQLPRYQPYLIDNQAGVGTQLVVADVNGDRSPDILTARRDGAFVFLNQKPFPLSVRGKSRAGGKPIRPPVFRGKDTRGRKAKP